jgi:hypothetical protein
MKLAQGMLATLSDGKDYIVISTIMLNRIHYVYLVENELTENMKFCIEGTENGRIKLTEVDDIALRQKLLIAFAKQFQQEEII